MGVTASGRKTIPSQNRRSTPWSQAQLEKKIEDYLLKSQFVAEQRGSPITASELQAEMERMASHSKQPDVFREIFELCGLEPR